MYSLAIDQMLGLLKVSRLCPEVTNWVNEYRCQCISVRLDVFFVDS